ncbi:hypothetical protein ESOMN_v1c02450 [Williamsoniiplasma somnilux]|uniref:Lipoprotein n=1 Tax=Williamsoniiplasma somnilux TaxID=215578 RepID=A0A2K8NXS9_9MOLU|nr:BspA family leucine-rich repeat surface protein [Williamsoniiplasma somnilux]ATZ18629.1 hypothetical protein ESOMN_v1c02450 [Williamsoniiplasma somnilux]
MSNRKFRKLGLLLVTAIPASSAAFFAISSSKYNIENSNKEAKNNPSDIVKVKKNLEVILNKNINKKWVEEELNNAIIDAGLEGITAKEVTKPIFRTINYEWKQTTWKFTGNGEKYKGDLEIAHDWISQIISFVSISQIENELQTILTTRKNKNWTKEELQIAVDNAKLDAKGAIAVESVENIKNRSSQGGDQKTSWRFIGKGNKNDQTTLQYKYNDSIEIVHNFNDKVDTSKNIIEKENDIQKILDSKVNGTWKQEDLQKQIDETIGLQSGIVVKLVENKSKVDSSNTNFVLWKFIGTGNIDNDLIYNGEIVLTHKWIANDQKTQISTISNELDSILKSKKNGEYQWTNEELQIAINTSEFGKDGGISVEEKSKILNRSSQKNEGTQTWIFIGKGNNENSYKYTDQIEISHNWKTISDTTQDIRSIIPVIESIINSSEYEKKPWEQKELMQALINAELTDQNGITVSENSTTISENRVSIGGPKITTWDFVGNGKIDNEHKYMGKITLFHNWDDKQDGSYEIKTISDELQIILDSKLDASWEQSELQTVINNSRLDPHNQIIVQPILEQSSRSSSGSKNKNSWKFIGTGSQSNPSMFKDEVTLIHNWNNIKETTVDIATKQNDLQNIINSEEYKNKSWTAELLEKAIEKIDVAEGITVQLVENVDTRSWTGGPKLTKWKFIGNGKIDNNYLYNDEITLEHIWNDKKDSTQNIKAIESELNIIVNEGVNKDKKLWVKDLQEAVNRKWPDEKWGIVVEDLTPPVKNRSYEESTGQQTFKFTGLGNENNTWIYNESIEIKHDWNQKIGNTQNIENAKNQLKEFINNEENHTKKAWTKEELQTALDNSGIDTKGGFTVKELKKKPSTRLATPDWKEDKWIIVGNGKDDNIYKYIGEISILHYWETVKDGSFDISRIEEDLQILLNDKMHEFKSWTLNEIQWLLDYNYPPGSITVDYVKSEANKNMKNEKENIDEYIFTGHGSVENDYWYKGSINLKHKWIGVNKPIDLAKDASIKGQLNKLIFEKSSKNSSWNQLDLQKAVDLKIDKSGGITVVIISNNANEQQIKFIGHGSETNSYKYVGEITIKNTLTDANDTTISKYIDSKGDLGILSTDKKFNFEKIDAVELLQIGYNANGNAVYNFKGKKITDKLPVGIKKISDFFKGNLNFKIEGIENWDTSNVISMNGTFENASNFNQDISNWDTGNVIDMSLMFSGAKKFNQDLSKWNVSKVTNHANFDTNANPNWISEFKPKFK